MSQQPNISLDDVLSDINVGLPHDERSITISSRHSETIVRSVDIIVQSRDNSYETRGDFVRDALVWAVKAWQKKLKAGDPMLTTHAASERFKRDGQTARKHHSEISERIKDAQDNLTLILMNGDLDRAHEVLCDYWEVIQDMTVPYWRAQYAKPFVRLALTKALCRLLLANSYQVPLELCHAAKVPMPILSPPQHSLTNGAHP